MKQAMTPRSLSTCSMQCASDGEFAAAVASAQQADATVILVGLDTTLEGEGHDRYSIDLPGMQVRDAICTHKGGGGKRKKR